MTDHAIAVTSMLIAFGSLLVAGLSFAYARSQAVTAKKSHKLDEARRHEERRPTFDVAIEDVDRSGSWYRLWPLVRSHEPVDRLVVEIVDPQRVWFRGSQAGVNSETDTKRAELLGLEPGVRAVALRIDREDDVEYDVTLRLTAAIDRDSWTSTAIVRFPGHYDVMDSIG